MREGRELSWISTVIMLYDHLQKDNFGIGSKYRGEEESAIQTV
jgi:hypothetical protein